MKDAVSIVEVGYRLDLDDDSWLRGVLRATLGAMRWDRGVIGFYVDTRSTATSMMSPPVTLEAHPLIVQAATKAVEMMPHGEQARFFMVGPTVATGSALMAMLKPSNAEVSAACRAQLGFADTFSVRVFDASGWGMVFAGLVSEARPIPPTTARVWHRVAAHLGTALRLRKALARPEGDGSALEAVLDLDGRVHHAEGAARSKVNRGTLRDAVLAMVRARGTLRNDNPEAALELWRTLVSGHWSLVDRFESDGRRYVLARRNPPDAPDPRGLSPGERAVAHYMALGHANKEIAYTLGLTEGTIASLASRVTRKLGVSSRTELVERIFGPTAPAGEVQSVSLQLAGEELRVVSWAPGVTRESLASLSASEREVAHAAAQGMSNTEIASTRSTSVRTVANQLATIYRKLGVRSRMELVRKLASVTAPAS